MTTCRQRYEQHHALAAEGVLAYVRDDHADLANITEAAVHEDALAAAWSLTARAAKAIGLLADRSGLSPEAALAEVVDGGFGGLFRAPQPAREARQPDECAPLADRLRSAVLLQERRPKELPRTSPTVYLGQGAVISVKCIKVRSDECCD